MRALAVLMLVGAAFPEFPAAQEIQTGFPDRSVVPGWLFAQRKR